MTNPKIHVAFLGMLKNIEHIAVRRSIDELILVYTSSQDDDADSLINKFANLGITVSPVRVAPNDFTNILSSTLNALDSQKFDQYDIVAAFVFTRSLLIKLLTLFRPQIERVVHGFRRKITDYDFVTGPYVRSV